MIEMLIGIFIGGGILLLGLIIIILMPIFCLLMALGHGVSAAVKNDAPFFPKCEDTTYFQPFEEEE